MELEYIVSNNQFYKNGLTPRNAKVLKCTLVVNERIANQKESKEVKPKERMSIKPMKRIV